jgi:hypothetical protein
MWERCGLRAGGQDGRGEGRFGRSPPPRYADDAIVHCRSEEEARSVLDAIRGRLAECGLQLHPEKTRVVYCKDDDRRGSTSTSSSTFSATPSNLDPELTVKWMFEHTPNLPPLFDGLRKAGLPEK